MGVVHVIGDVHGQLAKLRDLLRGAGLIDKGETWRGADSTLWLMGDLVDHGPDGVGAIELIVRMQEQAPATGGRIRVLLGNHDVVLLAAQRFGNRSIPGKDVSFLDHWQENGGEARDLERITPDLVKWLSGLPAMAREGDHLLVHADSRHYTRYGRSLEEVNRATSEVLQGDNAADWSRLLIGFGEHRAFANAMSGAESASSFLQSFGGQRIVHGHTPITKLTGQPPEAVREPLLYAADRCLNVDPGMYLGGPGFVCRLPPLLS